MPTQNEAYPNERSVRTDEDVYQDIFGASAHLGGRLPNTVMLSGPLALQIVLESVGCKGGVVFEQPPFDKDGTPFHSVLTPTAQFSLWGEPANQRALLDRGSRAKLGCFTMVLDLASPPEVVQWFYDARDQDVVPHLDNMLPLIVQRIDTIRWAYFPLIDEYPLAMFVAREEDADWVEAVASAAQKENLAITRVVKEEGRFTWHLPETIRQACLLAS